MLDLSFLYILFINLGCAAWIFAYGKYRRDHPEFKDPLHTKVFWDFDLWSVTHLCFHAFIGFNFPHMLYFSMFTGVAWELFEFFYGKFQPEFLSEIGGKPDSTQGQGMWWYAKWSDLVVNFVGFMIG